MNEPKYNPNLRPFMHIQCSGCGFWYKEFHRACPKCEARKVKKQNNGWLEDTTVSDWLNPSNKKEQ